MEHFDSTPHKILGSRRNFGKGYKLIYICVHVYVGVIYNGKATIC